MKDHDCPWCTDQGRLRCVHLHYPVKTRLTKGPPRLGRSRQRKRQCRWSIHVLPPVRLMGPLFPCYGGGSYMYLERIKFGDCKPSTKNDRIRLFKKIY